MIDIKASAESEFDVDELKADQEDNLESKTTCNKSLLPGPCSSK